MEHSAVNETLREKSNLNVEPITINQNSENKLPLKECNSDESSNNQQIVSSAKSDSMDTKTQIKCPQKREGDQLAVSQVAKKPKNLCNPPTDLVTFIAKHTHSPPAMGAWTKLKLINECNVLYLNPIPKSWLIIEMNKFMKENVTSIDTTENVCQSFRILRDVKHNTIGACIIKFRNPDDCHQAWFDLRGVRIDNTPVSVHIDLGYKIIKQVRKDGRLRGKLLKYLPHPEEPTQNVCEITTQKIQADENVASKNSNVATSNNTNSSTAKSKNTANSSAGKSKSTANSSNSVANSPTKTYNAQKSIGIQNTEKTINHCFKEKPSCMPAEKLDHTTYGINEEFLKSLGLKVPLRNVIIVIGLEDNLDDYKIREVFSLAGTVRRAFRIVHKGRYTWKGIVEYDHPVEAVQAVSMFNGKQLNGRTLSIFMTQKTYRRPLPTGLSEVGPGLGHEGEPLRGVRLLVELQSTKKMLKDSESEFENKIKKIEKTVAAHNAKMDAFMKKIERAIAAQNAKIAYFASKLSKSEQINKVPTQLPQQLDAASQLVNVLSCLVRPNILMSTLLSAQALVQQGMGVNQADIVKAMQNQIMLQSSNAAFAQNVDIQGMTPPPALPGVNPQPGLAQSELGQSHLIQPIEQTQMVFAPQIYYDQPETVQPGFMAMQTVPSPHVPQVNPLQPQTSYLEQTQSAPISFSQAQNQQILASKNHAQNVNIQGMTSQSMLHSVNPQPGLARPGLTLPQLVQPMEQPHMVSTTQPYYDQPQIIQPSFVPMPTVSLPASEVPVPQVNPSQPSPHTSYPDQTQSAYSFSPGQNQPIPAYTPKLCEDESSKNNAQNVNVQGMTQPTLSGVYPQPGLAQSGLSPPGSTPQDLAQPGLDQPQSNQPMEQPQMVSLPYYGRPQMVQPDCIGIQTVILPAPVEPQVNSPRPQTFYPELTHSASSFSQAENQQKVACTPKIVQNESSKNQATNSSWNEMNAQNQRAAERKPTVL